MRLHGTVAFADKGSINGKEQLYVQGLEGWFYLIVDAMNGNGEQYQLSYVGPFQD